MEYTSGNTYAVFHNVLLRETGVLFFVPDHLEDAQPDEAHSPPDLQQVLAWQFWDELDKFKVSGRMVCAMLWACGPREDHRRLPAQHVICLASRVVDCED